MAFDANDKQMSVRKDLHYYCLDFVANNEGVAKVMEFYAANLDHALELIRGDHSRRVVDVYQDGSHVCKVWHSAKRIHIQNVRDAMT